MTASVILGTTVLHLFAPPFDQTHAPMPSSLCPLSIYILHLDQRDIWLLRFTVVLTTVVPLFRDHLKKEHWSYMGGGPW